MESDLDLGGKMRKLQFLEWGVDGMDGFRCCRLACIWGELTDFDTKFCNTF